MSPATVDDVLARYAELIALVERGIAATERRDHGEACLIGFVVVQKMRTLAERLDEVGIATFDLTEIRARREAMPQEPQAPRRRRRP